MAFWNRNKTPLNTHGDPDLWAGSNILVGYKAHFPGSEMFWVAHPKSTNGLFVYEEDCNWDFKVHSE